MYEQPFLAGQRTTWDIRWSSLEIRRAGRVGAELLEQGFRRALRRPDAGPVSRPMPSCWAVRSGSWSAGGGSPTASEVGSERRAGVHRVPGRGGAPVLPGCTQRSPDRTDGTPAFLRQGRVRKLFGLDRTRAERPRPGPAAFGRSRSPARLHLRLLGIPLFLYVAFSSDDGRDWTAALLFFLIAGAITSTASWPG